MRKVSGMIEPKKTKNNYELLHLLTRRFLYFCFTAEETTDESDSILRVEYLLIRGDREHAIEEAIGIGDFATALLVASMCDPETYKSVAQQYARSKFRRDSPMYMTAMLFSGKLQSPPGRNSGNWGVEPEELIQNWKYYLAAIVNNRTFGWDKVVLSLADRLKEIGSIKEAHFCYVVCGYPISNPTDNETRLSLLGCDHSDPDSRILSLGECAIAFDRTEAYEWTKRLGNSDAYFFSFQPFKLIYAMRLADMHKFEQAQKFVESIQLSADGVRTASSSIRKVTLGQIFDDDEAFELACNEFEMQLHSNVGPRANYDEGILNGGFLEIIAPAQQNNGIKSAGPTPADKFNESLSLLQQGCTRKDPSLDDTFMTAASNLMDRSDYSLDAVTEKPSASKADTKSTMPPISEKPSAFAAAPKAASKPPAMKAAYTPEYAKKPMNDPAHQPSQITTYESPEAGTIPGNKSQLQQERPKAAPSTAPAVMAAKATESPNKTTPKKAPASTGSKPAKAPDSGAFRGMKSWLIKKLNPDAKECILPENEEQAYYDKDLKRWVFPGDDLAELAKPMAPPPMAIKKEGDFSKKDEPKDAISSMMAPPPSRGISARKKPIGAGPPVGMMPLMMSPMTSTGPATTPKFATFTPKAAVSTPKPSSEPPSEGQEGSSPDLLADDR